MRYLAFAAVLALVGCQHHRQHTSISSIRLKDVSPQRIAVTRDGSVWVASEWGGITHVLPDGDVTTYLVGDDDVVTDLVAVGDNVWFVGTGTGGRIDGHGGKWQFAKLDSPGAITVARSGVWFTSESAPGIGRLRGRFFRLPDAGNYFPMRGIAEGPDGALWFTESDAIARMTAQGRYKKWPVPHSGASRIVGGPDGALWFTEEDAHAIGRITTAGAVRTFALPGLTPYDIVAGDGVLWFAADGCLGRITTAGRISTWPVRKAGRLFGIAAAKGGGFWLSDDIKSRLWRVRPGDDARPCHPPTVTGRVGSVRAQLAYRRLETFRADDRFTDARMTIWRAGKKAFAESVPQNPRGEPEYGIFGFASSFAVRDLDGDGEPEVMLQLDWNGAHCCEWSRVYRYDRRTGTYVPRIHFWGDGAASPRLRDLDGDGRAEFLSKDDRFAYDFDGYAGSVMPIRIWSYREGRFHDTTRRFPAAIRRDAASIWRLYLKQRGKESTRGILPAWAADEYMLGRGPRAERGLAASPYGDAYVRAVRRLLRTTGYVGR